LVPPVDQDHPRPPLLNEVTGEGILTAAAASSAATFLQWSLDEAGLLSVTMAFGNTTLAGAVIAFAGLMNGRR
jgi:hypothetical protein